MPAVRSAYIPAGWRRLVLDSGPLSPDDPEGPAVAVAILGVNLTTVPSGDGKVKRRPADEMDCCVRRLTAPEGCTRSPYDKV